MASKSELQIVISAKDQASKTIAGLKSQATSLGTVFSILTTGAVAGLANKMIENASAMEQNRVAFETMLGSAQQASVMLKQINEFAKETPFNKSQVVDGSKQLLAYGFAAKEIIPSFRMLGDVASGLGMNTLPSLILAFGQIKAKGVLAGQELLQLTNAGFDLAGAMGISRGELMKMMEQGKITFSDVQAAFQKTTSEGGRFFDMMEKQSKTLGGTWSNLQDEIENLGNQIVGVSEDGTIAAGGLYEAMKRALDGIIKSLQNNKTEIQMWANALINGFTWVSRTLWNSMQNAVEVIKSLFLSAGAIVVDLWNNISNGIKTGNFEYKTSELDKVWADATKNMQVNVDDMKSAFEDAYVSSATQFDGIGQSMGELKGSSRTMADSVSKDMEKMEKKAESFTKKMLETTKAQKEAIKNAQEDIKKYREDFNKNESEKQADLATNIAKIIAQKNKEKYDTEKQLNTETNEETKTSLRQKIDDINSFLNSHIDDQKAYSAQIKTETEKLGMDEIQLLKVQFAEEKAARLADYESRMKDLRAHLKAVKKEYKERFEELAREIKKEGLDVIKIKVLMESEYKSDNSGKKHRATGGPVMAGRPYMVGERGPEMFIPSTSGRIDNAPVSNSRTEMVFNFNFTGAFIGNKEQFIREIQQTINRKSELLAMGASSI